MARFVTFAFLLLVSVYAGLMSTAYMTQRAFEYQPSHLDVKGYGTDRLAPWRDASGNFLGYVRAVPSPERVVVMFHGMGGEALNWSWYDELVPGRQVLVLAEYPGYGARAGAPSQATIFHAALDLMERVRDRWHVPVTVVGESLGTGVACYVARHTAIDRLALVSPFTSVLDVAERFVPFLPVSTLLKDRFPSLRFVAKVKVPLFVLHGSRDDIVPPDLGRRLFEAYPGSFKTFAVVPGADHVTINHEILHSATTAAFRSFVAGGPGPVGVK